jgi:hypothetical protein
MKPSQQTAVRAMVKQISIAIREHGQASRLLAIAILQGDMQQREQALASVKEADMHLARAEAELDDLIGFVDGIFNGTE